MTTPNFDGSLGRAVELSTTGPLRRLLLLVLVLVGSAAASRLLASVLAVDGMSIPEIVILILFAFTFAWISSAFWTAMAGFCLQMLGRWVSSPSSHLNAPSAAGPMARTALVVPVYHEDPEQVGARLAAVYRSVERTGELAQFDFFILSDSRDPDVVREEQTVWARLCAELGAGGRLFYRNRTDNRGRKAGNIADFCRQWGSLYSYFVVLDADSVMTGDTLVRLAQLMEANPGAGLIQTVPQPVAGATLFARIQQFAARLYSPMFAAGTAFWYPGRSNYWGHNAIIRTRAFMANAGLPVLPGVAPLGGEILSHDFVEAALLARAGWSVWLVPDLGGSYEELPPTLTDYAKRDRRWCQGNLQHLRLLTLKGLCPVSRAHLATGAMSYLASVFWLLLLLLTTIEAARFESTSWVYFPSAGSLFPVWPISKTFELIGLYSITMGMLLLPKVLAVVTVLLSPKERAAFGGAIPLIASALVEMIGAVLLAPILMLQQSSAVFGTLFGRGVSWKGQRRGDGDETWAAAASTYGTMTLLGVIWGLVAYMAAPSLLTWLSPVLAGLLLAVPMAVLSSQPEFGRAAQRRGWFLIPEEIAPPAELRAAAMPLAHVNHVSAESGLPQLHAEAALQGIGGDRVPTP